MKSTSMAEYFAVADGKGLVTVRQSNRNGVICCLTCLTDRCKHITAALPEIERLMLEQAAAASIQSQESAA